MRISIAEKFNPDALVDCFLTLVDCFDECATLGCWGPESFETTTTMFKSPIRIYRVHKQKGGDLSGNQSRMSTVPQEAEGQY